MTRAELSSRGFFLVRSIPTGGQAICGASRVCPCPGWWATELEIAVSQEATDALRKVISGECIGKFRIAGHGKQEHQDREPPMRFCPCVGRIGRG